MKPPAATRAIDRPVVPKGAIRRRGLAADVETRARKPRARAAGSRAAAAARQAEVRLGAVVDDEHERAADAAEDVGDEALVERGRALVLHDLPEAVHRALVELLLRRLLALHLQATTDGVEGVRGARTERDRRLRRNESRDEAERTLVVLVRVQAGNRVERAELDATVPDDANNRHAEPVVERQEAARALGRLHDAVAQAVERLLPRADIRREARTRVVERVHDAQAPRRREAARSQVHKEELAELRLRAVLREHLLDRVLERKVERLRREVADAVGEVTTPEGRQALLRVDTAEAVADARVPRHLAADDLRVGVLRLDDELHALDRRRDRLRDGPGGAAEREVDDEVLHAHLLRHGVKSRRAAPKPTL